VPKHNIALYPAEEEIFLRALESEKGLRVRAGNGVPPTKSWAFGFAHRMNRCRLADAERSKTMYPLADPRHGVSQFDCLIVRRKQIEGTDDWYIEITRREEDLGTFEVEEID